MCVCVGGCRLLGAVTDGIVLLFETDVFGGLGQDQSDSMPKETPNSPKTQ